MRIKVKILILIISTLLLILYISTSYTHRVVEKNREASLKEDGARIMKQIEMSLAARGDAAASKTINENFQEMLYPGSHIIADRDGPAKMPHHDGPGKETDNLRALGDSLDEMLLMSPHIARVDVYAFGENGALRPFLSKTKGSAAEKKPTDEQISVAHRGGMAVSIEESEDASYVNIAAPVHFRDSVFGLAVAKISGAEYESLLSTKRKFTIFVAAITIIIIAGVLIISMNYMVNRPIENLLAAISKVKKGDLGVTVEPAANDEIGTLTGHFNEMIASLRQNAMEREFFIQEINRHNDELQGRIAAATAELERRNEELSRANQSIYSIQKKLGHSRRLAAVGQLAAMVAHELGTPLHSISGHLQLLMEEPNPGPDMNRRLAIMQSQIERIIASIQNILHTTRPPEANVDFVDANRLLEDITILILPQSISRKITVNRDLQRGLPLILASRNRLEEAFLNLVDNAVDAVGQGGTITLSTRAVDALPGGVRAPFADDFKAPWLHVSVRDNGRGIPEDYLTHIFEPFYTTKAHGQGTGLGLAIAKEIVEQYNGLISVESTPGEGSTFCVFLPLETNASGAIS